MNTTSSTQLSSRDRAVLRAIAEGRCMVSGSCGTSLTVDGFCLADQFAGSRLASAGLITATGAMPAPAALTSVGLAVLQAA
ncbi:MAG: hypothetical protein QOC67_4383 [Pseudonocardiales bacterium]|jgi:hypothetical protein|nr:hypothetical protein [Pseudonocardia sp.]MDT7641113.1 hypothetical protein [Pseudonocardiales bacterium]MDT7648075.1 hypothetical protein [Pseudonocardiales bacterium]MDT7660112.1 hypothetical protein [Pseudonocardiales bacterium]MDT7664973.1 hypothetical protein [Pseudonocardiales bacterium]